MLTIKDSIALSTPHLKILLVSSDTKVIIKFCEIWSLVIDRATVFKIPFPLERVQKDLCQNEDR